MKAETEEALGCGEGSVGAEAGRAVGRARFGEGCSWSGGGRVSGLLIVRIMSDDWGCVGRNPVIVALDVESDSATQ